MIGVKHIGEFHIECVDRKTGKILWTEVVENLFHDEGEEWILKTAFTGAKSRPATFYLGIDNRVTIAESDVLPPTGEPSVGGYARQPVNGDAVDFTAVQDAGDWQLTSKTVNFIPSGADYPQVQNFFLSETLNDTGAMIMSVPLSSPKTVSQGEQLNVFCVLKVKEAA